MTNRFIGKTVAEYGNHGDTVAIAFTDGSTLRIKLSFDSCYYEGDRPYLEVEEKLVPQTLAEAIIEAKKWFEQNPEVNAKPFFTEWGARVILYRNKMVEELTKCYGERERSESC